MISSHISPPTYSASLVKASLKLEESRKIADLLLMGVDEEQWRKAIFVDNVLQKRSASTAYTFAIFIRQRLLCMTPEIWELVRDGANVVAAQAVLAATIKQSRLVGDFLDIIVRDRVRLFKSNLNHRDWDEYIDGCIARDPNVANWTPAVVNKLRQNVFRILVEADYLTDARSLTLQRVAVVPEIRRYLEDHGERYVQRCMEVTS